MIPIWQTLYWSADGTATAAATAHDATLWVSERLYAANAAYASIVHDATATATAYDAAAVSHAATVSSDAAAVSHATTVSSDAAAAATPAILFQH